MDKDVVQKEFQGGSFRLILPVGLIALSIAAFFNWQGEVAKEFSQGHWETPVSADSPVNAQPPVLSGAMRTRPDSEYINRSIRESDFYLVANHNLKEGTILKRADLKVVRMPGLHGYELAFFSPEAVIGWSIAHALPEGQPVLPYHVEDSLKYRKYNKSER